MKRNDDAIRPPDAGVRPAGVRPLRGRLSIALALAALGGLAWLLAPSFFGRAHTAGEGGPRPPAATGPTALFEDVAAAAGIHFKTTFLANEQGEHFRANLYDHGTGVAVADVDGDGNDDIYFCNQLGPNALYRGDGKGHFTEVPGAGGAALEDRISVSATFADYDGDGDQDLFVTTTRGGNALFRNRGDGTFEDVTEKAGVALVAHSQTATFFDADGDGWLDLLVTNSAKWTLDSFDATTKAWVGAENLPNTLARSPKESNRFYRNRGDGTFQDATKASGLGGAGWAGDAAVFDFEEDGDLDVAVGNMFGRDSLYVNDGRGHFRDFASEILGRTPYGAMGLKVFDYDGDGRLDLLIVDMHSDMWMTPSYDLAKVPEDKKLSGPMTLVPDAELASLVAEFTAQSGLAPKDFLFGNALYHALGGGRFEEVSDRAGVETLWPWGIAAGDFDGDGFEDLFLPSGMGYPYAYLRSPLLMNDGHGRFTDRTADAGLDPMPGGRYAKEQIGGMPASRSGRAAATADFDGDGRLDLVVTNFNDVPLLLLNRSPKTSFIEFKLTGTGGNLDAIGAVVRLTVGGRTLVRQVQSSGGYLAQSSKTLHFGLGAATKIDRCEIRWPGGRLQVVEHPEVGKLNRIGLPPR